MAGFERSRQIGRSAERVPTRSAAGRQVPGSPGRGLRQRRHTGTGLHARIAGRVQRI